MFLYWHSNVPMYSISDMLLEHLVVAAASNPISGKVRTPVGCHEASYMQLYIGIQHYGKRQEIVGSSPDPLST
jgi:hypothetical protein